MKRILLAIGLMALLFPTVSLAGDSPKWTMVLEAQREVLNIESKIATEAAKDYPNTELLDIYKATREVLIETSQLVANDYIRSKQDGNKLLPPAYQYYLNARICGESGDPYYYEICLNNLNGSMNIEGMNTRSNRNSYRSNSTYNRGYDYSDNETNDTGLLQHGLLSPYKPNAYGPGINMDATGRPFTWQPQDGTGVPGEFLHVKPNAYGLGIGMDQYGRPVTPACMPGWAGPC